MGFTALLVGGAAVVGGVAASSMNKPPEIKMPEAPKIDPVSEAKKAEGSGEQQRKRAAAASAANSTILTGPQGLGEVKPDQQGRKNLLGY